MDASFEMAQAFRRSHCDRKGREHECVGEVTIKRGHVCLNCPVCGPGDLNEPDWDFKVAGLLDGVFNAAGISWSSLSYERQLDAIKTFKKSEQ